MATIVTKHVQEMINEAAFIAIALDEAPTNGPLVEYHGHEHPPAMLLALAINRLRHAAEELETSRLACFGLPEEP